MGPTAPEFSGASTGPTSQPTFVGPFPAAPAFHHLSIENLHVSAPPAELPPVHYEDIHVSVQRSPIVADGSYQAVLKFVSDQREVTASGRTLNIREQVQRLHFSREGREGALSAHPDFTAQLKKLGLMVYDSIFKEPVRRDLLSMLYSSRNVRLHWLGDPSDAASSALPWESLFVPSAPVSFLALTRKYSLMRRYAEAKSMPVSLIGQTVRILFVTASPSMVAPLPGIAQEIQTLRRVLDPSGRANLQVIENATVEVVQKTLREFRPHVFQAVSTGQRNTLS